MRSELYSEPGGWWGITCGVIGGIVGWFFDLSEWGIVLSVFGGLGIGLLMAWMDLTTNRLARIEEKLDDLDYKLDTPNDRPLDTDL